MAAASPAQCPSIARPPAPTSRPGTLSLVHPIPAHSRSHPSMPLSWDCFLLLTLLLTLPGLAPAQDGGGAPGEDAASDAGDQPPEDGPPAPVLTKPPALLQGAAPVYPDDVRGAGVGGPVTVRIVIDATGAVTSTELVTPLHPVLDASALEAAGRLLFSPAEVDGEPAPISIDYTFHFDPTPPAPEAPPVALGSLDGTVTNHRGQPVADVLVSIVGTDLEASTDATGAWSIPDVPAGPQRIVLFHPDHERAVEDIEVTAGEGASFAAVLVPTDLQNETVVLGRKRWKEVARAPLAPPEGAVVGSWEMTRRDVEVAAGAMGDVARVVQQLPGVTGDGDFFATFHVRGGDVDETLFYLDGIELQNPNHLGGVFTLFNPAIADRITLHAAGPPALYGESLAGALNVETIDGDNREVDGVFDINMAMASAWVSGPLGKKGSPGTFLLSARRSFLEPYFGVMRAVGVLSKEADFNLEFGEYLGRLTFEGAGHKVRFTYMHSHDRMRFGTAEDPENDDALLKFAAPLDARNRLHLGAFHWDWRMGPRVQWDNVVAITHDEADRQQEAAFGVTRRVNITRPSWRSVAGFSFDDARKHTLRTGFELAYVSLDGDGVIKDPRSVPTWAAVPWADLGAYELAFDPRKEWTQLALFLEDDWQGLFGTKVLDGRLGVRVTPFNVVGKPLVSPRASLALRLPTFTTLKASFALTHQTVKDPLVYDPVAGADELKAQRAIQIAAAVEQLLPIGALIRVEAYHRRLDNLLVNPDTRAAVEDGQSYAFVGSGNAMGIDVFFGWRGERFNLAATYSLGSTMRTNPLNQAGPQTFRPFFDQRHAVRVGGDVKLGKKKDWMISGTWEVRSGRPRSPVIHQIGDDGRWRSVLYDYNQERYGLHHELSVRVENSRVVKDRVKLTVYLDVLNAYNAQSQYVWVYGQGSVDEETGRREAPRPFVFRQLPIRPWFGFRAEW